MLKQRWLVIKYFVPKRLFAFLFLQSVFALVVFMISIEYGDIIIKQQHKILINSPGIIIERYPRIAQEQDFRLFLRERLFKTEQDETAEFVQIADLSEFSKNQKPRHDTHVTAKMHYDKNFPAQEVSHNPQEVIAIETRQTKCLTRNIVFVKTHKTAGTTVQNVLIRYGLKRFLKFALPAGGWYGYPGPFRSDLVLFSELKPFNIICHHMRFNYREIMKVMAENPLYITILREPGELFQSTFDFFYDNVPQFHNVPHRSDNAAEKWLDFALEFDKIGNKSTYAHFTKNHLMFDLGYSKENNNETYISIVIKKIKSRFDLVLISDYMDQSLVLLADLLCLPMEEVATLRLNKRDQDNANGEVAKRISEKARRWNKADAALFDYFNKTLWKKVEQYGFEKMSQKIDELHSETEKLKAKCIENNEPVPYDQLIGPAMLENIYQPTGVRVTGFKLKPEARNITSCVKLISSEIASFITLRKYHEKLLLLQN